MLPLAVILASITLASAIVYAARTIASAIARQSNEQTEGSLPLAHEGSPLSAAGFPVEPSGVRVEPETPLELGSNVLAFSQGRWWRAEVTGLHGEEQIRIHYAGWDPIWDESVPRDSLQVDLGGSADDGSPYDA